MSTRTSIGGDAGLTKAWWWPGDSIGGPMSDPTWAVSLGVGPAALGACTDQVKSAIKPSTRGVHLDGPATAQWCPQPESAGDERCPAQQENTP